MSGLHPHVIGQAHRIAALREFIALRQGTAEGLACRRASRSPPGIWRRRRGIFPAARSEPCGCARYASHRLGEKIAPAAEA